MTDKKEGQLERDREIVFAPRIAGLPSKSLMQFYQRGISGDRVVYATPQGNFYSPAIVKELLAEVEQARITRTEMEEKISKLIEDVLYDLADEGENWDYRTMVKKYKSKYLTNKSDEYN